MPQMGESVTEGTVLEWLKQVGDRVEADEPLVEVSTDKVDAEVPAPASGTLTKILAEPDSTVAVGRGARRDRGRGDERRQNRRRRPPPRRRADRDAEAELVDVLFPEMGDSVAEGTVLEWRVAVGDAVAVDDVLVEISTDKVDAEVPSPVAGTSPRSWSSRTRPSPSARCSAASRPAPSAPAAPAPAHAAEAPPAPTARRPPPATARRTPRRSPPAWPARTGSTSSSIKGSGPRGRVTKEDVAGGARRRRRAPRSAARRRRRGQADPRPGGHARPLHEREPLDPDRHQLPHARRRRARRPPPRAQGRRAQALLHPPDRLGDRPGRARHAGDGPLLRRGRTASRSASCPARSASAWPSTWSARTARARSSCRCSRDAGPSSASPTSSRATTSWSSARATTRCRPTPTPGANITLTNPGGIGTVASVPRLMPGQGTIVATGAIGYPPGLTAADPERAARARRRRRS